MTQPIDEVYVDIHARGEDDAARDVERAARKMARDLRNAARQIERDMQEAARDMSRSIELGAEAAERSVDDLADSATRDLRRIEREAHDAGTSIRRSLGDGPGGGRGGLLTGLSEIGAHLRNISALTPPPILLALAAAVPAVIALGGALADLTALALLLPGVLGALISSFAALKLSFTGIGDAVEALASGDLAKINEAMKNLAPSAREFAREIDRLREPLRQLRIQVQEAFFAPLRGDLTRLVNAALPTLRTGLSQVSGAFGELGSSIFALLGSQDILESIGAIFASTARIIKNITPQLTRLLDVFFGVAERGLPFVERMFTALGRGMDSLTGFLDEAMRSGDFERFLEDAFQIMSDLGGLTRSLFDLMGALFGDMGDEGSTFIQTLTAMTDRLTEFLNSAEGQAVLQRIVDTLPALLSLLETGVIVLAALGVYTEATLRSLEFLGQGFVDLISVVGTFFGNLGGWIAGAFGALQQFFGAVVAWVTNVQDAFGALFNILNAFPEQARAILMRFLTFIQNIFTQARDGAHSRARSLRDGVLNIINSLPTRTAQIFYNMRDRVLGILNTIVSGARNAGRNILNGLINGLRSGFSSALEAARRIAFGILNSMRNALGISSPSHLAAVMVGEPLMQGVGVGAENAATDLRSTLNNAVAGALPGVSNVTNNTAGGQSIVFGAGAVQVVFQGAVPTEQEALRTGQAVAAGIAQTLARRTVRTAVRIA